LNSTKSTIAPSHLPRAKLKTTAISNGERYVSLHCLLVLASLPSDTPILQRSNSSRLLSSYYPKRKHYRPDVPRLLAQLAILFSLGSSFLSFFSSTPPIPDVCNPTVCDPLSLATLVLFRVFHPNEPHVLGRKTTAIYQNIYNVNRRNHQQVRKLSSAFIIEHHTISQIHLATKLNCGRQDGFERQLKKDNEGHAVRKPRSNGLILLLTKILDLTPVTIKSISMKFLYHHQDPSNSSSKSLVLPYAIAMS
jgi:hypothetical protein